MVGAAVDGTRHVTHLLQSWTPRPQANTSPDPLLRFLFLWQSCTKAEEQQ